MSSLLASRLLPLGAKGRLFSTCVQSIMLYGNETWAVNEEELIRLERNNSRTVRWKCNIRSKDRISAGELRTRLKLNRVSGYLLDRRLFRPMVTSSRKY